MSSEAIPYLKLHMKNGELYLLHDWKVNDVTNVVAGTGGYYDLKRQLISTGGFSIPINQLVLAETNHIKGATAPGVLGAMTVVSAIVTVACLANPKACFGSCPTFYANNGEQYVIQSEGFSSSIAPSLEAKDVDALYNVKPNGENFEIQLRNEAYETHVIRSANLLAVPKTKKGRSFSTPDGKFIQSLNMIEVSAVTAPEGDISEMLCTFDGIERYSSADSNNLAAKEIIEITFNNIPSGNAGLVIASRQSLLTTFLFYQALSYMGSSAGEWIAKLERSGNEIKKLVTHPGNSLGKIELLVKNSDSEWEKVNEIGETGPIATDIKAIPFEIYSPNSKNLDIRLRMTKGMWRIDYVALAELGDEVKPVVIPPSSSYPQYLQNSYVIELLNDPDSTLVTFPGDKYFLNYKLPTNFSDYELFIESQGYYLEWMRDEWLVEEDPSKVYKMFLNPKQFLKDLAPQFKKVEADMEEIFWSSKYVYP
jgi:hypothetical protein